MLVEVLTHDDNIIATFNLPCNPFKVGEILTIKKNVHQKDFWEVEEMNAKFIIDKIDHHVRIDYGRSVNENFTLTLTVSEHETN